MKAKIYLNYFNDAELIENEVLTPIQVGAEQSKFNLPMLKDNKGKDNISQKNPTYCEMTGIYWVWKNDKNSDYIGFFHYRRLLDFNLTAIRNTDSNGLVNYHGVDNYMFEKFHLHPDEIKEVLVDYDAILPEPFDITLTGNKNVYEQYINSNHQFKKDIDITLQIIKEMSPEYFFATKKHFEGILLYPTNIFVFKREIFESLCKWLFPILAELENRLDTSSYSFQENRVIGYISERLISAFIEFYILNDKKIKYIELKRVFLNNTAPLPVEPPIPNTKLPILSLAVASDINYVPHLASLLSSVIDNHRRDIFLDIIILDGGIWDMQKKLLSKLFEGVNNVQVTYLDMESQLKNITMHSHFTQPTLYRLYLPEVLKKREKILYLDTDMVVVDSLLPLYNMETKDYYVLAAKDLIMRSFVHKKIRSHQESGGLESEEYLEKYVGMNKRSENYFQAGTLLLNLRKMRDDNLVGRMIDDISNKPYWFLDQDILNKYLGEKVKLIDNKWNVIHIPESHLETLTEEERKDYLDSQNNPVVIHYAGTGKPWLNNINPHSHYYWYYLRKTAWYETILFSFLAVASQSPPPPIQYKIEVPKTEEFVRVYERRFKKRLRDLKGSVSKVILNKGGENK